MTAAATAPDFSAGGLPKVRGFADAELKQRKLWIDQHVRHSGEWWQKNLNLVLHGVSLTMAPKPLNARQRHAAQGIKHAWMREGEKHDPKLLTYNRYGVQLGVKVPLWGGFTGGGKFALRLWTPRPKMTKEEWQAKVPSLKRAIDLSGEEKATKKAKVWHDNEGFLKAAAGAYKKAGMEMHAFPPNSGDLNPIETVRAWLRHDLAKRELEDISAKRDITVQQFRQRVSQILKSYSEVAEGQRYSRLTKLVRGMPRRLQRAKDRSYGRCGM